MSYSAPGVYVEEIASGSRPIEAVGTSVAVILGIPPVEGANLHKPVLITDFSGFRREFYPSPPEDGPKAKKPETPAANVLATAVEGFFQNGGGRCYILNVGATSITGEHLEPLDHLEDISLILAPGYVDAVSQKTLISHCEEDRADRLAILETPRDIRPLSRFDRSRSSRSDGLRVEAAERGHACIFTPWVRVRDARSGEEVDQPPSGHIAGSFARTDAMRGVHKAPANIVLCGVLDLCDPISHKDQEQLNSISVNCIRAFPDGIKIWGARTLAGANSDMRYIPVRRLVTMVALSLQRGTQWVVFEPNDEFLWKSLRRDIGTFLNTLWRAGALRGSTAREAYYVRCDAETTTQADIDNGRVIAEIGLATVKPAEFVVLRISHAMDASASGGASDDGDGTGKDD